MTEPTLKLPTDELFEIIHENDALKRACDQKDAEIAELSKYKHLYEELKTSIQN